MDINANVRLTSKPTSSIICQKGGKPWTVIRRKALIRRKRGSLRTEKTHFDKALTEIVENREQEEMELIEMKQTKVVTLTILVLGVIVTGCMDANEAPTATSLSAPPVDTTEMYPYPEYVGISADSVNALGRLAASQDERANMQATVAWQLYVSVPFYSQLDPSWKDYPLGFNYCKTSTIGRYGCHLCCIAMHYAKWGYGLLTPKVLNDWSMYGRAHYAFSTAACGDLIRLPYALEYGYVCRPYRYITAGQIYTELQKGHPVVIEITIGHFMVIFAFDGRVFWVKDPLRDWQTQDQPLYGLFKSARVYGYY